MKQVIQCCSMPQAGILQSKDYIYMQSIAEEVLAQYI